PSSITCGPRPLRNLPPIMFPQLEKLSGDLRVLASFLPSDHTEDLTCALVPQEPIPDAEVQALLQGMRKKLSAVRTFSLQGIILRPGLNSFHGLLDHMEILQLSGLKNNELQKLHLTTQELHLLSDFPSLREVVLSDTNVRPPIIPQEDWHAVVTHLFEECPKLALINVQYKWDWLTKSSTYRRWMRGSTVPVELTSKEVIAERFM
ncbi:hypothetical protein CPB84DRAFT_1785662, partial [Gymnopilus junonius]